MWGGGGGPMMGGPPPGAAGAMWGTAPGTQFAGIPPDMLAKVEKLFAKEPEYDLQDVPFTQVVDEHEKPFTLRQLLWPRRLPILGVLVLVAFEAFALQFGPRLVELAINNGIDVADPDFGYVAMLAGVYVGLLIAATLIGAVRTLWSGRIGEDILYGLRLRVFSHIQRLSLDFFTDEKAGRIMTRVTSDIEAIQVLFQQGLVNMWLQLCTLIVIVWQMFAMSTTLALYVVGFVVPVMTIITAWFRSESDHGYLAVRDWIAGLMSDLQENLSGTRVVAAHNRQPYNTVKHRNLVGEYRKANLYTGHIAGLYGPGSQFVGVLATGMVVLVGGHMVLDGTLSLGDVRRVHAVPHPTVRADPAAGAAVQHLPAGRRRDHQAPRAVPDDAVGAGEARRVRAAADRGRDHARGRHVRVLTRRAGARARRPHDRGRARRSRWSVPPARASRRSPSC